MNIFEPNSLLLFILFFVPGFVSMKIYDLLIANESRNASAYLFDAVAYSAITFVISFPFFIGLLHARVHNGFVWFIFGVITLLVIPALIAFYYVKLLKSNFLREHALGVVKRPWDVVFGRKHGMWVIVHLKNGKQISGIYSSRSAISYYPTEEQIYLEKVIFVNSDGTTSSDPDSKGAIIMGSEISLIELFKGEDKA